MKRSIVIACLIMHCQTALPTGLASSFGVLEVRADRDGRGYIKFDQPLIDSPASCINGYPNHLSFNTKTAGGKAAMSVALSAQATGKKITARGTGSCDEYSVIESWNAGSIIQ